MRKTTGNPWFVQLTSPLAFFLSTEMWLCDRADVEVPLQRRWLVPESLLVGQYDRFAHLDPLSF
jgi:hypothetical protein